MPTDREADWNELQNSTGVVVAARSIDGGNTVDKLLNLNEPPVFARKDALTKKEELAIDRLARALASTAFDMLKNQK